MRAESFEPGKAGKARTVATLTRAPIDTLVHLASRYQDRVRDDLQHGVVSALATLSETAETGRDEALVIVYRILFLLFVEARDLVPRSHAIYGRSYSVGQLVREALADRDARGSWDALAAITRLSRVGCRTDDLIVRPFNGRLFARRAAPSLEARSLSRRSRRRLRRGMARCAARSSPLVHDKVPEGSRRSRTAISASNNSGAVYERVLDLEPAARRTTRQHSSLRKQTGTFYTPQPLAEFVVRRTLAPLVAGRPRIGS